MAAEWQKEVAKYSTCKRRIHVEKSARESEREQNTIILFHIVLLSNALKLRTHVMYVCEHRERQKRHPSPIIIIAVIPS